MNKTDLILRNLRHFLGGNAAVVAGMAVATAVLVGALLVGDSVRGSLRELALQRLGETDYALVASRFFGEDLGERLAGQRGFSERFLGQMAGISVRGGVGNEAGDARVGGVQIMAVEGERWGKVGRGKMVINGEVAEALGARAGETVALATAAVEDVPRDAALARRSRSEVTATMRGKVQRVADGGDVLALFGLTASQRTPRNVWVNFGDAQSAIGQEGKANLVLVSGKGGAYGVEGAEVLNGMLREVVRLEDYGLKVEQGKGGEAVVNSQSTYILPAVERAGEEAAREVGGALQKVSVYLANKVERMGEGAEKRVLHYCIVAGLSEPPGGKLEQDEVAINAWTAEQMGAKVGDRIRLSYYQRQAGGELKEVASEGTFRVARVVPMSGLGADATLTPAYRGLTDADSVADWQPPEGVEIDKKLVTRADEAYWEEHKAAPKVFVSLETVRRLWGSAYGEVTSLRVPGEKAEAFERELLKRLDPAAMGLAFRAVKAEQVAAASGSTDFSGLFVGFSFFLIVAAGLLVAMLFRLGIEQRARQFGLMAAMGFGPRTLQRLALAEGMILAVIGGIIGTALGVGYTWVMIWGLRTWWVEAVGTTALRLHVGAGTLGMGLVASLLIAAGAVVWGVWRVGRTQAAVLLAGGWQKEGSPQRRGGRREGWWVVGIVAGLGLLGVGVVRREMMEGAFLGGGSLLLVSSLAGIGGWMRGGRRDGVGAGWSVERLGVRNAGRHRGRSVMTIGLIAFASFALVTVASMRQLPPVDTYERESGTGGYQLVLQAEVPLLGDLQTLKGREMLGVRESELPIWERVRIANFRSWAGQDVSCLNITRPTSPTILAVPEGVVEERAFQFARTIRKVENPWELLREKGDGVPVIADNETAQYILKLGVGETMEITDQLGRTQKLKLVATLSHSIFQGELLMGEENFLKLFPSQSGFGVVLVGARVEEVGEVRRLLEVELEDYAVTVERAGDRLARYQQVANTYLSTFQTLGALGLMLGTIGLAVVLLRSLVERRGELALLTAIGFGRGARLRLILAENAFLLVVGLGVGTVCALVGIVPALVSGEREINVAELLMTLTAVAVVGLGVLGVAVWVGGRGVTVAGVRGE